MRSYVGGLTSALAGLSQTQLDALEVFWEIDPDAISTSGSSRTQKNSERLAAAMGSTWAAMAVIEKLSDAQRAVLKVVCEQGNIHHTAFPELEAESQEELFGPLLENLVVLIVHSWAYGGRGTRWSGKLPLPKDAYLGIPGETIGPITRALKLFETTAEARLSQPLPVLMGELDQPALGTRVGMAPRFVVQYAGSLPGLLASSLRHPDQVKKLLQHCSPRARRLFAELIKSETPVRIPHLLSGPSVGAQEVLPLLNDLQSNGLVFPIFLDGKRACFVPHEVAVAAQGRATERAEISDVLELVETPVSILGAGQGLWWNIMVAGLYIESDRGDLTATTHQLPKKTINQLAKVSAKTLDLSGDSSERIDEALFWLGEAEMLVRSDNKLQFNESWQKWRTSSLFEQVAWILEAWLTSADDEMGIRLPGIDNPMLALVQVRQKVLGWLREIRAGEWLRTTSWTRRVLSCEPFFLRSEASLLKLVGRAGVDDLYQSWHRQEGYLILKETFALPLQGGLIEVGWDAEHNRSGGPTCFRLTDFGEQVLRSVELIPGPKDTCKIKLKDKPLPPEPVLVAQPNREVVLLRFEPRAAYALGRFAQPVSFDQVGSFLVSAESVRAAASRGIGFAEMKETLERFSTTPVPQNIEYQLKDWAGTVRKVRFERGTIVEVDSPEDLEMLLSSKAMKTRLIRRLSPTAALVSVGEDVKALGKLLEPQGFSWNQPKDWEKQEAAVYASVTRTLKRFEPARSGWGRY